MNEVTLRGSHYEMGRLVGKQLREAGTELPALNDEQTRYIDGLVGQVEGLIPDLFDEMRGLAEAGGYDERVVYFYALSIGIVPSCTVVAVSGAHTIDGKTLFGRNYDAGPEFADFTLYRTYPEGGLAHIGCAYDLLVGREDGVNEAGLAIAVTGVHGHNTDEPGLWDHIPVRAVLDRCGTVDEAVTLLETLPHLWTKNFLVADKTGEIAMVEAAQQKVFATRVESGFGTITNHFEAPEMRAYCDEAKIPANSVHRRETAYRWFEAATGSGERLGRDQLKRLLSTTGGGVRSELREDFTTVWSWIAALGERGIELSDRLPEEGSYRECTF
jgi:predicted choloylglycine hydrolase